PPSRSDAGGADAVDGEQRAGIAAEIVAPGALQRGDVERVEPGAAEGGLGRRLDRQVDDAIHLALRREADDLAAIDRRGPVATIGIAAAAVRSAGEAAC